MHNKSSPNLIKFNLIVSFQGKTHDLHAELDLNELLANKSNLPPLHDWIAKVNKIDSYSYLYEVLQAQEIVIYEATGLAADFVKDNKFDSAGFIQAWYQAKALNQLQHFAQTNLNENLDESPALKQALLDAFNYGFEQGQERS